MHTRLKWPKIVHFHKNTFKEEFWKESKHEWDLQIDKRYHGLFLIFRRFFYCFGQVWYACMYILWVRPYLSSIVLLTVEWVIALLMVDSKKFWPHKSNMRDLYIRFFAYMIFKNENKISNCFYFMKSDTEFVFNWKFTLWHDYANNLWRLMQLFYFSILFK